MPSDRRLHPLSILFNLAVQVREFALPGLLIFVSASSAGWGWQVWTMPLIIPYTLVAIGRYVSFRYRYEENEMVIRTGLLFRNERHVPYARIQNLDAVQNPFHRVFGVAEVRVETGAGQEPEATMRVLTMAAVDEMRRRVFMERSAGDGQAASTMTSPGPDRVILHLPPRELIVYGLIRNRGVVLIAAALGLLWELGLWDRLVDYLLTGRASGRRAARELVGAWLMGEGIVSGPGIALAAVAFVALLLFIRLISITWALVGLHRFTLTRAGEDLRTEYGLLTKVVATIPLRRIQTLTVREGLLHRLFGRVSVNVETAGADAGEGNVRQREWLAPIIATDALPRLVRQVLPELDLAAVDWRTVDPRAVGRVRRRSAMVAVVVSLLCVKVLSWFTLVLLAVLLAWAALGARLHVAHLGWAVTEHAVLFRSGWLLRQVSVARFARIQAVAIHESPLDRRAAMARVSVDTAGATQVSHRVDIPYLPRGTARSLCDFLAARAGQTAFRW